MANINSQKKRIRQDKKRNLRNKSIKTELKTVLKSLEDSSVENKSNALKTLDIAYSKGIITKNFRDRNKNLLRTSLIIENRFLYLQQIQNC